MITYYEQNSSIDVFNEDNWTYFCQFLSCHNLNNVEDYIKVYIPLGGSYIEEEAKIIRFDDIVIRLIHSQDVTKLIEYVNNNSYIRSGLIAHNPFTFQKGGIALACDGRILL